jgi:hypothetical protein
MRRCHKRRLYAGRILFLLGRFRPVAYVTLFWVLWYASVCARHQVISTQKKNVLILHGDREGMGIGLFIARSIVAAHGGMLFAENAEGAGAQFWLQLPTPKEIGV